MNRNSKWTLMVVLTICVLTLFVAAIERDWMLFTSRVYFAADVSTATNKDSLVSLGTSDYRFKDLHAAGDSRLGDITLNTIMFIADTSSADDCYGGTITPAPTFLDTGMVVYMLAAIANTGACELNFNGLTKASIKMLHDQEPADNYIEDGSMVALVYDGATWQLMSPDANP